MCKGPLAGKILTFALPLVASGLLQLLFNAADMVTVGRFAGSEDMAAVGATGALYNLIINVFVGLSTGGSVLMSRYYGAKDEAKCRKIVHTSVATSLFCGVGLIFVGLLVTPWALRVMGTPEDVLPHAVLYMRIVFCGMPVIMLYNFGSGILRAVGDTRRPLIYLTVAGIVNVCLNLILVIVFDLGVAGVAIATVTSQLLSSILVVRCLMRSEGACKLVLKEIKVDKKTLVSIAQVGVPAGLQGCVFSLSNVVIQSSVNSFGSATIAGSAASANIEGFVYVAMNAFYQACISFTSQNYGAGEKRRVLRVLFLCLGMVFAVGAITGFTAAFFGRALLGIYSKDPAVVEIGYERLLVVCIPYFLCGMNEVVCGGLRGMGLSLLPTIVTLLGVCGTRVLWVMFVFPAFRSIFTLYLCYPVSWALTIAGHSICYFIFYRRWAKNEPRRLAAA